MKIFLDANVLVAVLNKEYPLFSHAARVLSLSDRKEFEVFTSPICLAIAFYFAEKKSGTNLAREKIVFLSEHIRIAGVDEKAVRNTCKNKSIHDFEDGLQYYAAESVGCEAIITENPEDFYFGKIKLFRSEEFLAQVGSQTK